MSDFPAIQTIAEELAGLFQARNALESIRGDQPAEVLRCAFGKRTRGMTDEMPLGGRELDAAVSCKVVQKNSRGINVFTKIAKVVCAQLVTIFSCWNLGADSAKFQEGRIDAILVM